MPYFTYRIVDSASPNVDGFRSYQALGRPRPRSLPPRNPDPWDGVSVFETREQAARLARRRPDLGRFIAKLYIPYGAPVARESASGSGHYNLWADASALLAYVVDVTSV